MDGSGAEVARSQPWALIVHDLEPLLDGCYVVCFHVLCTTMSLVSYYLRDNMAHH